nr:immunoglobulin heavy chain junction region [Macaca mulatta]MOW97141.1 immunoglobulin heavy chain junction region [Macaca mulatta]
CARSSYGFGPDYW